MNRNKLKQYAPKARRDFIRAVTDRTALYGLTRRKIEPVTVEGDVAIIVGRPLPNKAAAQRQRLEARIARQGFESVMEAMAYTWFNRFVALRYMEIHGYLDHGYRVLSPSPLRGEGALLAENLTFIADSLGPNRNEQPRDTLRRYLATGFYKHHLSLYKRRPIYWLFSSGKQRAFQCLVYLHRYNESTLSRLRTAYVIPLQGKLDARIDHLGDDIAAASSTSHRRRLEKERDKLLKQREELLTFDEQLRHYADQRIRLDLDDGVKVNYGKFGDPLAEVKAVTGKEPA
jgi:hypothetical protein